MDSLSISVDNKTVLTALDALPGQITVRLKPEERETADRLVEEMQRRVARKTGLTAQGIHAEPAKNGKGMVVLAFHSADAFKQMTFGRRKSGRSLAPASNLPRWIEFGTKDRVKNGHKRGVMPAMPFFFASEAVVEADYHRRVAEGTQEAIDDAGLGA